MAARKNSFIPQIHFINDSLILHSPIDVGVVTVFFYINKNKFVRYAAFIAHNSVIRHNRLSDTPLVPIVTDNRGSTVLYMPEIREFSHASSL